MSPCFASLDILYWATTNVEQPCHLTLRQAIMKKFSNFWYLIFTQLGIPFLATLWSRAMSKNIILIFSVCRPTQVRRHIICLVAIPMRNLRFVGRPSAIESSTNENVNFLAFMPGHINGQITLADSEGRQNFTLQAEWTFAATSLDNTVKRPHAPEARNLVAGMSLNRTPFLFHRSEKIDRELVSHVARFLRVIGSGTLAAYDGTASRPFITQGA